MASQDLFDLAATRKILTIGDTADDPELIELGAVWTDNVENDIAEFVDFFPLTGEALNKARRCCSLGVASGYKNNRNNEKQTKYYLDQYNAAIQSLGKFLMSKPKAARVSSSNEYVTKPMWTQTRRL